MRVILFLFLTAPLFAQEAPYFQQEVNYDISVRLDDRRHELHGHLRVDYVNNSPDTLTNMAWHLWPRAFSGPGTAFARQQLRSGNTDFHFSDPSERGTLDSLAFLVNDRPAQHLFQEENPDIAWLNFPGQPLLPGERMTITTPFRVKIPESFSRLGHVGESYQITQWYPKPALYDRAGWHPMPYLDQGEYFSDFGSFKVAISLPENYVVGATGVLQDTAERAWLLEKAGEKTAIPDTFPPSAASLKTLHYVAELVHDFAWFADKRFRVDHDTLQLARPQVQGARKRAVDVWAMYTAEEADLWAKATDYLKRSLRFYSDQVGSYPYPQMTAVQSALSAGGGMEYPMLTVIGLSDTAKDLDEVLAHEVGHNWFQGILATNERDHAWMDEGINSYYEQRYMQRYYDNRLPEFPVAGYVDQDKLGYHLTSRLGQDQAPSTRADSFSYMNYWIAAYSKPALALHQLASEVSTVQLDRAMREYFQQWQFRHPRPEDFFAALNTSLGDRLPEDFPAVFNSTTPQDYLQRDSKKFVYRLGILTDQELPDRRQIFFAPLAGWNRHDGIMLGVAAHNRTLEPRRFEWLLAPMFGFSSDNATGVYGARYRFTRPFKGTRQLLLSGGLQGFSDFTLATTGRSYQYRRGALKAELTFDHPQITERQSRLSAQFLHLSRQRPRFENDPVPVGTRQLNNSFYRLGYKRELRREISPRSWSVVLEYKNRDQGVNSAFESSHLRLDATLTGGYQYEQGRFLRWRAYGGYFFSNDLRESASFPTTSLSLVDNANADYRYDDLFLGRNAPNGNWGEQQVGSGQGGFRAPIGRAFNFGRSNSYLTAVNVDADLPLPLPLGVFLDTGYYGTKATTSDPLGGEFNWVGGVSLTALEGRVGLFLPLVADPDTKELLEQRGNLLDRLSFRLSLNQFLPWRWVDDLL